MKRLSKIVAVVFTLLLSIFFVSCGNKYKKLKISFDVEGQSIQLSVDDDFYDNRLDLEDNRGQFKTQVVTVKFSGIKKKHVGKIEVKVVPSSLAVIQDTKKDGKEFQFKISALESVGMGEVVVTHASSGKSKSISLEVNKKAYSAKSNDLGLVLNLPKANLDGSESYNYYTISPSKLMTFAPADASDSVHFELTGKGLENVELGHFVLDEGGAKQWVTDGRGEEAGFVNNIIRISSKAKEGSFEITPTLVMANYEDIEIPDIKIKVSVINVIENLKAVSKNAITESKSVITLGGEEYKLIEEPVYLFANSKEYSSAQIQLFNEETNVLSSANYNEYYDIEVKCSGSMLTATVNSVDKCIDLQGLTSNTNMQEVEVILKPKNSIGQIKEVSSKFEVYLTEVATSINTKIDRTRVETTINAAGEQELDVDLLDVYLKNDGKGELFNFSVKKSTTHKSLKAMQIKIDLDMYKGVRGSEDGLTSDKNYQGKNQYLVEFYINNYPMWFNHGSGGITTSQSFTEEDNIYIKYVRNEDYVEDNPNYTNEELSFKVETRYDGSFGSDVLWNVNKVLNIDINRKRGVKGMEVSGGQVRNDGAGSHEHPSNNDDNIIIKNEDLLDDTKIINNGTFILNSEVSGYGIRIDSIEFNSSIANQDIGEIDFYVDMYRKENGTLVKAEEFEYGLFNLESASGVKLVDNEFKITKYFYDKNTNVYTLLLFKKDGATVKNGSYELVITEPLGGLRVGITVEIVVDIGEDNVIVELVDNNSIIDVEGYREYLFGEITDVEQTNALDNLLNNNEFRIVPTGLDLNTLVKLGIIDSGFKEDSSYLPYVSDIKVKIQPIKYIYDSGVTKQYIIDEGKTFSNITYMTNDRDNLVGEFKTSIKLSTKEYGTVVDNDKCFVKVDYLIYTKNYEKDINGFYEEKGSAEVITKSYYFFIYVKLGEVGFANNKEIINTFFYDELGYYYKEKGENHLEIEILDPYNKGQNMFDYVDYSWDIKDAYKSYFNTSEDKLTHSLNFTMNTRGDYTNTRDGIILANITQFGTKRTIMSTVHVRHVEYTEKLLVKNNLRYLSTTGNYYLYLEQGDLEGDKGFVFDVQQLGSPTFKGVKYVVCDMAGNVSTSYKITDNKLVKIPGASENIMDLKVIIFATDWLKRDIDSQYNSYNFSNLTEYVFEKDETAQKIDFSKQVKIIDVKIRDGSEANPYLIATAEDFKNIKTDKHYELVNDINLNKNQLNITEFGGGLSSYKDYQVLISKPSNWETEYSQYYKISPDGFVSITGSTAPTFFARTYYKLHQNIFTVYNVQLTQGDNKNLFTTLGVDTGAGIKGKISNINFDIIFNLTDSGNIGLIGTNLSVLENVKVEYSGSVTTDGKNDTNLGILVAENRGYINYTSARSAYSTGRLTVADNTSKIVNIGGLVGKNLGEINGILIPNSAKEIEYVIFYENQGSLFDGYIEAKTENNNLNLGGVVGLNDKIEIEEGVWKSGKLSGVYSSGSLKGYNNIGGLIGKNNTEVVADTLNNTNSKIIDSLSSCKIEGNKNIGGIVGTDEGGSYYHVYYEVYDNGKLNEHVYSIMGESSVGGLIGSAKDTSMRYCYFHSFRWNYQFQDLDLNTTGLDFEQSEFRKSNIPDIYADEKLGGIIGTALTQVSIYQIAVDGFLKAGNMLGGFIGYTESVVVGRDGIIQGAFISATENDYFKGIKKYQGEPKALDANVELQNSYSIVFGNSYQNTLAQKVLIINETYDASIADIGNAIKEAHSVISGGEFASDENINNGRKYLVFNSAPLITLAPNSIVLDEALVDGERTDTEFKTVNDGVFTTISPTMAGTNKNTDKVLVYYYHLIDNQQANYAYDSAKVNIISLDDIINKGMISILPTGAGKRLKVSSDNERVATISSSGEVRLLSEGVVTLTFASIMNSAVSDSIKLIIRAMPSDYNIYKNASKNENLDESKFGIVQNESKFIYEEYIGIKIVNGTEYLYNTTNNVTVFANVFTEGHIAKDEVIEINGELFDAGIKENTTLINEQQPIIISVKKHSATTYTVTIDSYVRFRIGETDYYVLVASREFDLETRRGISAINSNITDAVMSVADEMSININLVTDMEENDVNLKVDVKNEEGDNISALDREGNVIANELLFKFNNENMASRITFTGLNSSQTFVLTLNENLWVTEDLFVTLTFSANGIKREIYITLIPQKISSIIATSYKQDSRSGTNFWTASSIIRPDEPDMMVIDVGPVSAYYDHLEITDTSSEERIGFIQWSEFDASKGGLSNNGQALSELDKPSSDGFGIKLAKTENKSYYVHMLLGLFATNSAPHIVKISAYSSSGYLLGESMVSLEVLLRPTIILSYYNEHDQIEATADSRVGGEPSCDLATGIRAKIGMEVLNADTTFNAEDWTVECSNASLSSKLSVKQENNGYWYLTYDESLSLEGLNALVEGLIGTEVRLSATIRQVVNGFEERGTATLIFKFKRFTLNSVTAQTGRATSGNRLGGILNEQTYLEFYFNNIRNKDISYYQNGEFHNDNYFVDFYRTDDKINDILIALNSYDNENVKLELVNGDVRIDLIEKLKDNDNEYLLKKDDVDILKLTKETNRLLNIIAYSSSINSYYLELSVTYHYNISGEVVLGKDGTNSQLLVNRYYFNFTATSSPNEYLPIRNSQEFLNMVEGQYYILVNDIELKNYAMLDIKLGGFDGNGHKIKINNFNYDSLANHVNGTTGYLGLFKQIYSGSIVENLTVEYGYQIRYNLSEHYASDNTDYTGFNVGGICAINEGIITNCKVIGDLKIEATKISPASLKIGGITAENTKTGYITNSTVEMNIDASGIIAGVVTINEGKIATTNFKATISAYSQNSSYTEEINTACFVLTNKGEISMCYVDGLYTNSGINNYRTVNSGGSLGGFVYENDGKIYDCYLTDMELSSRGFMGGFVYSNTGTIERCYINPNDNLQGDRYIDVFAYNKAGIFVDCYYILTENIVSSTKGISCITEGQKLIENNYHDFAFNGNGFSVWKMTGNGPKLANAGALLQSKYVKIYIDNGVEKVEFSVPGSQENPYIIYDVQSFNHWFSLDDEGMLTGHYRIVADIDFKEYNARMVSQNKVLIGTLEGNNMVLSNFNLFTQENERTESVGLFKEIRHTRKDRFVSNLILNCATVRASNATSVGVLAGVINGANVFNINIDNPSLVVIGKNAVGGLAGHIKGDFVVENIRSNASIYATYRQTIMSKTNLYNGMYNTGVEDTNISTVSYAGGIVGILEGYDYRIYSDIILNNFYTLNNAIVTGDISMIAETTGGVAGLVTERSRLTKSRIEVSENATLKALYYSGGLVGENRGIIDNCEVLAMAEKINLFDADLNGGYANCNGGIASVNYSGLIYNCYSEVNVVNKALLSTVGGIVGRNVGGTINDCDNRGMVYGFFAGNIAGADYDLSTIRTAGNSAGAITENTIQYLRETADYSRITISGKNIKNGYTLNYAQIQQWYEIQKSRLEDYLNSSITHTVEEKVEGAKTKYIVRYSGSKILGAIIATTDKNTSYSIDVTKPEADVITIDLGEGVKVENVPINCFKTIEELYSKLSSETVEFACLIPTKNAEYNFYNIVQNGYNDTHAIIIG